MRKEQEEALYKFQSRWFEVVLKQRGSLEVSSSPVALFDEKIETVERKMSAFSDTFTPDK